jgi:hypothetical protein
MMKPYALHSLVTALVHCKFGIPAVAQQFHAETKHGFAREPRAAAEALLALAQAHEAKETEGPYATYVWGCLGGTNRIGRRHARNWNASFYGVAGEPLLWLKSRSQTLTLWPERIFKLQTAVSGRRFRPCCPNIARQSLRLHLPRYQTSRANLAKFRKNSNSSANEWMN